MGSYGDIHTIESKAKSEESQEDDNQEKITGAINNYKVIKIDNHNNYQNNKNY